MAEPAGSSRAAEEDHSDWSKENRNGISIKLTMEMSAGARPGRRLNQIKKLSLCLKSNSESLNSLIKDSGMIRIPLEIKYF